MIRCGWCGAPEDRRHGREACRYCDTVYQHVTDNRLTQVMELQSAGLISRKAAVQWLMPAGSEIDEFLDNDIGTIIRYTGAAPEYIT